jgi:formylglycine-generating enzyme required for sulfatase activity
MTTTRNFTLLICACIAVPFLTAMESCNDEPEEQHIAFLQEAMPNSGTNIGQHATITISFDASPENLTASSGTLSVSGTKVTINGPFPPGPLTLILKWEDGETTLNYIVRPPGIGDEITTATGTTMVFIPAGEFEMGSNAADQENWLNEAPVHTVYVDAFYMDKYEVTNADFQKFVLANPE